jgi:hypothetical protein
MSKSIVIINITLLLTFKVNCDIRTHLSDFLFPLVSCSDNNQKRKLQDFWRLNYTLIMMIGTCGQGMMQRRNNLDVKLLSSPSDRMKVSAITHSLKYGSSADVRCLYPFLTTRSLCVWQIILTWSERIKGSVAIATSGSGNFSIPVDVLLISTCVIRKTVP